MRPCLAEVFKTVCIYNSTAAFVEGERHGEAPAKDQQASKEVSRGRSTLTLSLGLFPGGWGGPSASDKPRGRGNSRVAPWAEPAGPVQTRPQTLPRWAVIVIVSPLGSRVSGGLFA